MANEISGDEAGPFLGSLVGVLVFRMEKELLVDTSLIRFPRLAARKSRVEECQDECWALKSLRISESSWVSKRGSRLGL